MSDPLHAEPDGAAPQADADRAAKIESLLLAGLDHYFSSDYAQAIDVWTRALFLDRSHARARAYIERARSALAEQQRESEELLHSGVAAFERGEMDAARQLLNAAVHRGGAHDVALAFLARIDRINAAAPGISPVAPALIAPTAPPAPRVGARRLTWLALAVVLAAGVAAAAAYGAMSWDQVRTLVPVLGAGQGGSPSAAAVPEAVAVPRSSDQALDRARQLFATGRLLDAQRALDLVRRTDARRTEADQLRATIQRELLAHEAAAGAPQP